MRRVAAVVLACACTVAQAQTPGTGTFWTGNDLLAKMTSTTEGERWQALGYIMGATDVGQGTNFCIPGQVTAGQLSDIIKQHLESAPAARHIIAGAHILYAFSKVWPCAQRTPASGSRTM